MMASCMKIRNTGCSLQRTCVIRPLVFAWGGGFYSRRRSEHSLEFDGQRDGVDEDVNLKDAEEEEAEVFEHLGEKVPEEADVGRQVGDGEAEDKSGGGSSYSGHHLEHWNQHFTRQDFRQATCAKVHTNFNSRTVRTPDLTPFPLGLCLVFNDGFFF